MSIVLYGYGMSEIDSGSSIVAWGLSRDLNDGETVQEAIASADVSQLFVIDYGLGRRKPTAAEIRKFRRISALISTRGLRFTETKGGKGRFTVTVAPILREAA